MADTNYFIKTVTGLFPGNSYRFQFRWKYVDGTYSDWSATRTVTAAGSLLVEAPTLATGLTAETASFAVTISWDGTYASSAFLGFKSVNIYASTSNLGSSTTTNLSANLVGSMTVDQIKNKITIGSTLLKNTLSLTSTTVYTTPIYFYYITVNDNNEVYQSGGVATYTRINSSGINPTQANFVDLANGVISIENLVAGNGQFQEYLRVGTAGSARVEIGGNSVVTTGAGVVPGLSIYNSGNQAVLSAPLSGGLEITGATIRSSTSSGSIKLDPSYDALSFYSSSGNASAHFIGSDDANNPGVVIHTGSAPNSILQIGSYSSTFPQIRVTKNLSGAAQGIYLWLSAYGANGISMFNAGSYGNIKINGAVDVGPGGFIPQLRNIDTISTTQVTNYGLPSTADEGSIIVVYTP